MDEQKGQFALAYGTGETPLQVTEESPYPMIARALIFNRIAERLSKNEREDFAFDEVQVISFTYISGNWKAVVSTTLLDMPYYVVTYDAEKQKACVETYVKTEQVEVAIPARRGRQ